MSVNPFVRKPEEYRRTLDFYKTYVDDAACYLSKMTGTSFQQAKEWVVSQTKKDGGGQFALQDPLVKYLEREIDGDRELKYGTLLEVLKKIAGKEAILTPNMSVYCHPKFKTSLTAQYLVGQLANRSRNKNLKFEATRIGDKLGANIYDNRQNRNKIKCNSVSGAHGTKSSVLCLPSAHSTLTSTCRSASSNTNANTERFLRGNRHYWSYETALNNIVSIINHSDYAAIRSVVTKYELPIPSVDFVFEHVLYSTRLYWKSAELEAKLLKFILTLNDYERCAYIYTGCLYTLAQLKPTFVRSLLQDLSEKPTQSVESPQEWIDKLDEDAVILLILLSHEELRGRKLKDKEKPLDPETLGKVGALAKQLYLAIQTRGDFIRTFWCTENMPASMARFPESIRRCVVASDTDSSIFTTGYWTEWYVGEIEFSRKSDAIAAATTYLTSQLTVHLLACMSGNMGVPVEKIHMLAMKNEYAFPVFCLTSMAKHYFANMSAQEGLVYEKKKLEIKGATLRNSKAPDYLMEKSDALIEEILETVSSGKRLVLRDILQRVADEEHVIRDGIRRASSLFFSTATIKGKDGYKTLNSPYLNYTLWMDVFSPKYGVIAEPPYRAIKMSLTTDTKNKLHAWLDELPDQELAERFRQWLLKYSKKYMTTIFIPISYAEVSGIPEELLEMMDYRKLVYGLMSSFYLILESLGYFIHEKNLTKLVSDYFPPSKPIEELRRF